MPSAGFEYPPMMMMTKEADADVYEAAANENVVDDDLAVDDSQGATTMAARPLVSSNLSSL